MTKKYIILFLLYVISGCVYSDKYFNRLDREVNKMEIPEVNEVTEKEVRKIAIKKAKEINFDMSKKELKLLKLNTGWLVYIEPKEREGYFTVGGVLVIDLAKDGTIVNFEIQE